VLGGLGAFRGVAWAWMATVLVVSRAELSRPRVALLLCGVALALTVGLWVASRRVPHLLLNRAVVGVEVAFAAGLLVADGWVYGDEHRQSLGSAWPLAGTMAAGVAAGPVGGVIAGVVVGLGRVGGTGLDRIDSPGTLSLLSTAFLYALAGGAAGLVMRRLGQAEQQISAVRAREEVARTLHDGVLQTLAVVQRRSSDRELAALARTQERELREYLFGVDRPPGDLLTELRATAARAESHHGVQVELTTVDDPGRLAPGTVHAVTGAVGEALTNAAKHGGAGRAVVFVDPGDDELFVSVHDDGAGFDPGTTDEGVGLGRSIRGRIGEVGGHVEVVSSPGQGTEVRLRVPT